MKDRLIYENGWQVQREREQDQVKKMDRLTQDGKIKTKKICIKKEIR